MMEEIKVTAKGRKPIRSVLRATQVIKSIGAGSKGPSAIAADLEISKGTVFDLLKTLEAAGFVRQDPASEEYLLGPSLMRLSAQGSSHASIVEISAPHLQRLSDETGEVTHLGQRDGTQAIYLHRAKSRQMVRMLDLNSLVGAHSPLHCTSLGKVFLAQLTNSEFADFASSGLKPFTSRTICDPVELARERTLVRERGYGLNIGEYEDGVSSVAVPLRLDDGPAKFGINFAMPSFRLPAEKIPDFVTRLKTATEAIRRDHGLK